MDDDRPKSSPSDDRLGFNQVALHLAQVIVDQSSQNGLVFGIEGEWGSGKSTLINLIISALRKQTSHQPEIIEFSPWLVGNRDGLLHNLFDELANAAARIDPIDRAVSSEPRSWFEFLSKPFLKDSHYKLRRKNKLKNRLEKKLKAFGVLASGLSKLVKASGEIGVPLTGTASAVIEEVGRVAKDSFSSTSLPKRKAELVEELGLLSRQIVVFIDDLDRLDPHEVTEVLRLIRAVADFPNVVYILSYDPQVIAKMLQSNLKIDDGSSYLRKIVQVSLRVPRPEAFDLRRWFETEIQNLFSDEVAQLTDHKSLEAQRLAGAIEEQGGAYLKTPRDVIRTINALRLHGVPVRDNVDFADMVWLQLVRLGNPELYFWVEEYLTEVSAFYRGAYLENHTGEPLKKRLIEIIGSETTSQDRALFDLGQVLPGISSSYGHGQKNEERSIFDHLRRDMLDNFIQGRRLGSPEHYRYYFAFAEPAGAIKDDQVEMFIDLAQRNVAAAIRLFSDLSGQIRPQGGVMAEVMIDRIVSAAEHVPDLAVPGIFASFASALDQAALSSRNGNVGHSRIWSNAERAVKRLLQKVHTEQRKECLRRLFSEGQSLGWISSLMRGEIFAHGHCGHSPEPEAQRLLTTAEFKEVLSIMHNRYMESSAEELLNTPNLLGLLYGWQEATGTDDAKNWAEKNTKTDKNLLIFLSRSRGWPNSSSHSVRYPLKRRDLSKFLDYESSVHRVEAIANNDAVDQGQRELAKELLVALQQGEEN